MFGYQRVGFAIVFQLSLDISCDHWNVSNFVAFVVDLDVAVGWDLRHHDAAVGHQLIQNLRVVGLLQLLLREYALHVAFRLAVREVDIGRQEEILPLLGP